MPLIDYDGKGTMVEFTENELLLRLTDFIASYLGVAELCAHRHASGLADFRGTHFQSMIAGIQHQAEGIEKALPDQKLRQDYHDLVACITKLGEIDEQVVQFQARLLRRPLPATEQDRRKLEQAVKKHRMEFLSHPFPPEVQTLAAESSRTYYEFKRLQGEIEKRIQELGITPSGSEVPEGAMIDPETLPPHLRRLLRPRGWRPTAAEDQPGRDMTGEAMSERDRERAQNSDVGTTEKSAAAPAPRAPHEKDMPGRFAGIGEGIALFAQECFQFYHERALPKEIPDNWPWNGRGNNVQYLQQLIAYAHDETIRELLRALVVQSQRLDDLNDQWRDKFAAFLKLPLPQTEMDVVQLRKALDKYRRKHGAAWTANPEFQELLAQTQQVVAATQGVRSQLHARVLEVYPESYGGLLKTHDEIGDQRAKDLIDESQGAETEEAIRLLKRALRYGHTGIQASKAYGGLGHRYKDKGDVRRAIENYSKSVQASSEPNAVVLFSRGELYYQQGLWQEARADFERALSSPYLYSPEREQAQAYLTKLRDK